MVRRIVVVAMAAMLAVVIGGPASATTQVYGDPGSDDFSVALSVTHDPSVGTFVLGAFYGTFQGHESSEWDLWVGKIASNGDMDWVHTWDAPELDNRDFAGGVSISAPWLGDWEILIDDSKNVRARVANGQQTLLSIQPNGTGAGHTVTTPVVEYAHLLADGSGDIVGYVQGGNPGVGRLTPGDLEVWTVQPAGDFAVQMLVTASGRIVVGQRVARQSWQSPAVAVTSIEPDGSVEWDTTLFEACFENATVPVIDMDSQVGVITNPPQAGNPNLCDVDVEVLASLDAANGSLTTSRTVKDTLNIIWCEDPRRGPITEAIPFGFVDGDECGGEDVFWTDVNNPLVGHASPIEGFGLMGLEIVSEGYLGYGIVRSGPEGDRWDLQQFDYLGPRTGFAPYDMVVTQDGTIVVGRSYNTAWISTDIAGLAAASAQGAATYLTLPVSSSGRFVDDNDSTFEGDIEWMAETGVTKGCNPMDGNTRYCPDSHVTRGQMAAFLVRALGLTDRLDNPFVDDDDSVFEADIEKLAAAGITRGCNPNEGNTKYCPDSKVTRGQMAAFLVRALGYTDNGGGDVFVDDDDSIFENDIDRLGTAGVTKGCNPSEGNTKFCPNSYVTRGQMAAFLHRALG